MISQVWQTNLARGLILLLSLLALWLLYQLISVLLMPIDRSPERRGLPQSSRLTEPSLQRLPAVAEWHLFGRKQDSAVVQQYRDAPVTPLKLLLAGIVSGAEADQGYAIIIDAQGQQGVYAVGDEVPGEAAVEAVYQDRVVLLRAGAYETLRLPKKSLSLQSSKQIDSQVPTAGVDQLPVSAAIPEFRDQLVLNVARMASSYGLVPVKTGGYRLALGRNARQIAQAGLQNGDVILAANGVKLSDQAAVATVLKQALSGEVLVLEVQRNGQRLTIQPDLSQFNQ